LVQTKKSPPWGGGQFEENINDLTKSGVRLSGEDHAKAQLKCGCSYLQ
jgi:hypothetical protein